VLESGVVQARASQSFANRIGSRRPVP